MNLSGDLSSPVDRFDRRLGSLRVSVTDRCNMRCRYCMPEEEYVWLPRTSILTFEETARLTAIFAGLGAGKVRLTGGEPLLRHDLAGLVRMLGTIPGVRDLALTTNGILLSRHASELRRAGLHRVTVSLDTLRPARMLEFARTDRHADVLEGIRDAVTAGYRSVKINSVIVRGFNDDEVTDLLEFARESGVEARFIEYMDVGGATLWSRDQVVSQSELLEIVRRRFGPVEPLPAADRAGAPAERFRLTDGTIFGIIASTTAPFCRDCDRSRLTADGTWFLCLYAGAGINLRDALRSGASDRDLGNIIVDAWTRRADRGAEERLAVPGRGALYQLEALRADPRREMHTRGG
ncbi:MAG TPA: GTP 3',8-cyclase MoaA [Gemmatimonadales bacterium]|nr:GTP 3',8-cyclase MoaA [Gemmatimonadales bacterium]